MARLGRARPAGAILSRRPITHLVGADSDAAPNATTVTVTVPAATVDGNIGVLAWYGADTTSTPATPSGWTLSPTSPVADAGCKSALWTRTMATTDAGDDIVLTSETQRHAAVLAVYRDVLSVHAIASGTEPGTDATHAAPTATVTSGEAVGVAVYGERVTNPSTAIDAPAGYLRWALAVGEQQAGSCSAAIADNFDAPSSSSVGGGDWVGNQTVSNAVMWIVALQTTAGAGGGTNAPAEAASASGVANNATVSIAPNAGHAAAAGTANTATPKVAPNAGAASGTGTANNPAASIAVNAGHAAGTGTANNPTVVTGAATNAPAGLASGTGTANNPTAGIAPNAGTAAATGTANNPAASVKANAGTASATGVANNATVSTASQTQAPAGAATASGTANNATVKISPNAGVATGVGTVNGNIASIKPNAGVAAGSGTANNPTVARGKDVFPTTATVTGVANAASLAIRANAEVATALAQAFDADIPAETIAGVGIVSAGYASGTTPIDTNHGSSSLVTAGGRSSIS